jgi:hypothetical protein
MRGRFVSYQGLIYRVRRIAPRGNGRKTFSRIKESSCLIAATTNRGTHGSGQEISGAR